MNWAASSRYSTARLPSTRSSESALRTGAALAMMPTAPAGAPAAAAPKMMISMSAFTPASPSSHFALRVPPGRAGVRFRQHGLRVDHRRARVAGQLVLPAEHDRAGPAGLLAKPEENAAELVYVDTPGL